MPHCDPSVDYPLGPPRAAEGVTLSLKLLRSLQLPSPSSHNETTIREDVLIVVGVENWRNIIAPEHRA